MTDSYEDIIHLPNPTSKKHPRMSPLNRAAQFAPFAALTGYESSVTEARRETDEKIELDEDAISKLQYKLNLLLGMENEIPPIEITYFLPDARKEGGQYLIITEQVKKYDESTRRLIFVGGQKISIESIVNIESAIFDAFL